MSKHEAASFSDRLRKGMEDSISYSRGDLSLKTTTLPAPPLPATRSQVVALRKKLQMSQSIFAATLNVSTKLVQSWEQGLRTPDHGELRLIEILTKQPEVVSKLILSASAVSSPRKSRNGAAAYKEKATA
jgi:putative transcriptional regulator